MIHYCRTSFERQILESLQIQENSNHFILNSKRDYNRCAIHRLQSKVEETEFKTWVDEKRDDKEKEKENKIRDLRTEPGSPRSRRRRYQQKQFNNRETGPVKPNSKKNI